MGGASVARIFSRTAPRALQLPSQRLPSFVQRRFAGGHGHEPSHEHHSAGNQSESFGPGFYAVALAIPTFTVFYNLCQPGEDGKEPALTQWIAKYNAWASSSWVEDEKLLAQAAEQAAFDRLLFQSVQPSRRYEPRSPDSIYIYSPRNISASQHVNLDAMTDRYRRKLLKEEEEAKARRLAEKAAN